MNTGPGGGMCDIRQDLWADSVRGGDDLVLRILETAREIRTS